MTFARERSLNQVIQMMTRNKIVKEKISVKNNCVILVKENLPKLVQNIGLYKGLIHFIVQKAESNSFRVTHRVPIKHSVNAGSKRG